jgi:hypothetical protein
LELCGAQVQVYIWLQIVGLGSGCGYLHPDPYPAVLTRPDGYSANTGLYSFLLSYVMGNREGGGLRLPRMDYIDLHGKLELR